MTAQEDLIQIIMKQREDLGKLKEVVKNHQKFIKNHQEAIIQIQRMIKGGSK